MTKRATLIATLLMLCTGLVAQSVNPNQVRPGTFQTGTYNFPTQVDVGTLPSNYLTIIPLSTPIRWTLDTTSPTTALASIFSLTTTGSSGPATLTGTTLNIPQYSASIGYPGAGIANSTGSAWGTSYSTTGSGSAVALSISPTIISPTITTSLTATGLVTNADLVNPATTVNGQTCTLGSTCTVTATASNLVVGTTTISSGTNGDIEYNNSGVLGEKGTTGSGSVVLATSPSIASPTITSSFTATGLVTNGDLANPSTTVNSQTCTLGSSCSGNFTAGMYNSGDLVSFTNSSPSNNQMQDSGIPISKITTGGTVTYTTNQTAQLSDNGKMVIMDCSSSCAYTLPNPQPSSLWGIYFLSIGSTPATIALSGGMTWEGISVSPSVTSYRAQRINANSSVSTDYDGTTGFTAGTDITITPTPATITIASAPPPNPTATISTATNSVLGSGGSYSAPACASGWTCDGLSGMVTFTTGNSPLSNGGVFSVTRGSARAADMSCLFAQAMAFDSVAPASGSLYENTSSASTTLAEAYTYNLTLSANTQYYANYVCGN